MRTEVKEFAIKVAKLHEQYLLLPIASSPQYKCGNVTEAVATLDLIQKSVWQADRFKGRGGHGGKPKPPTSGGGHASGGRHGGEFAPGGGRIPGHGEKPKPSKPDKPSATTGAAAKPEAKPESVAAKRVYAGQLSEGGLTGRRPVVNDPSPGSKVARPEQEYSTRIEARLANSLEGRATGRFRGRDTCVDVIVRGGRTGPDSTPTGSRKAPVRAIECKVMLKGDQHKITMHPDAKLRKAQYVENNPARRSVDVVVFDHRNTYGGRKWAGNYSGHEIYYKRGADGYNLAEMHKVKDVTELKRLMKLPDDHPDLPAAARAPSGWPPKGEAKAKLEAAAAKMNELRKASSVRQRQKKKREAATD